MRLGNGKWETTSFNARLQPVQLGLGASATDYGLWKVNYEYGELQTNGTVDLVKNNGNIAKQTLNVPGTNFVQAYKYDPLNRLTEAKETTGTTQNWIQQFGYDVYGNRAAFTQNIAGNTSAPNPTVDANTNRFVTGQGFAYDKNGNVVNDIDAATSQSRTFVFNGDNKQTQVKDVNNNVIGQYFYDGEGKRVKKVTDSETTIFVYSAGKLVAEYSTQLSTTPSISYTTTDHLGSPRIITDQFGQVKSRRDFLPFGEDIYVNVGARTSTLKYGSSNDDIRQKFTGYQKDSETSLDFAEARMYENRFGRFTAVDPLVDTGSPANPQTFNRYVYVLNNPFLFVDKTGAYPQFSFSVYVRAFAPFQWFGPGNIARGDNRGFSTSSGASFRIQASSEVQAVDGAPYRYFPMSMTRPSPPTTSETNLGFVSWTALSETYVNDPSGNYYADGLPGGNDSLGYHMYGNDDAIPGSSNIDLHPEFRFTFSNDQGNGLVDMNITGTVTGDQFPAAEAFIRDTSGNSVMLGVFAPTASSGPVTSLPGNGTLPMIDVNVTVRINNGVFQGVVENGNVISLDEYNRRFTNQPPVRPNQQ